MHKEKILDNSQINKKIKRISLQIIESNLMEDEIIVAGIEKNGFILAEKICAEIRKNSKIKTIISSLKIDKKKLIKEVKSSINSQNLNKKSIVIIDDVLNSGSTLMYAVKYFLDFEVKKIKTAVLIDRNHKKFPVKADFKGLSLSTSLQSHVEVSFDKNLVEAFLI